MRGGLCPTLPFTSDTEGGLGKVNFSIIGKRYGGGRLNAGEDTKSMMVAEVEWDVDGNTGMSGGFVD